MPKEIINQCEQRMQKTIEALKKDFATIRTGKANPSILNGEWLNIMVHRCQFIKLLVFLYQNHK